jgi:hypothetical protein
MKRKSTKSWVVSYGMFRLVCVSAAEAEAHALSLARRQAADEGLDSDTVALYDLRDRGGDWGACPDGDEGGYYPKIREVK